MRHATINVAAAALGGAIVGLALGKIGALLRLDSTIPKVIVISASVAVAAYLAWRRPGSRLGWNRQVRRRWPPGTPPWVAWSWWGLALGIGLLTALPYSSWLVVYGTEATAGPVLGAVAGGALGAGRQSVLVYAAYIRHDPGWLIDLLGRFQAGGRAANLALIVVGGGALALGSLP